MKKMLALLLICGGCVFGTVECARNQQAKHGEKLGEKSDLTQANNDNDIIRLRQIEGTLRYYPGINGSETSAIVETRNGTVKLDLGHNLNLQLRTWAEKLNGQPVLVTGPMTMTNPGGTKISASQITAASLELTQDAQILPANPVQGSQESMDPKATLLGEPPVTRRTTQSTRELFKTNSTKKPSSGIPPLKKLAPGDYTGILVWENGRCGDTNPDIYSEIDYGYCWFGYGNSRTFHRWNAFLITEDRILNLNLSISQEMPISAWKLDGQRVTVTGTKEEVYRSGDAGSTEPVRMPQLDDYVLRVTALRKTTASEPPPGYRQSPAKNIDIAICIDTSGSMDDLVLSAKIKLWDIVNDLAKIKPAPNLRVALYSYGNLAYDANSGWIRKDLDLTTDLDAFYKKLFSLRIYGGSEYVTRVCRDAVDQLKWSEDPQALKIIFVCGNEPADQDQAVSLRAAADKARAKGIFINTIYCKMGWWYDDYSAPSWPVLANLAGGRHCSIDQSLSTAFIVTPQDGELLKLNDKLNATCVVYGGAAGQAKAANQLLQDANALQLGFGVLASRVISKASGIIRNDDWDLVDRLKNDPQFDLKNVPESLLSEELKNLTPEERKAFVRRKTAEREALLKQILELGVQREVFVAIAMKKNSPPNDTFDSSMRTIIREQAASKGIMIPK